MVGGVVGGGGGAAAAGVVTDRAPADPGVWSGEVGQFGLFVGGPLHGTVMGTGGQLQVCATDHPLIPWWVEGPGVEPPDPQVAVYNRRAICLEIGGVVRVREVWSTGVAAPAEVLVREALMIAWFKGGPKAPLGSVARPVDVPVDLNPGREAWLERPGC